jgi:DNA-binding transcriptional MerR regulator
MTREAGSKKKSASAFRTISEVADELEVQQHVLRFWETKFTQVKPLKRGGGRRYYRPEDIALLKHIHDLLYKQGYTIKGVQKLLKGQSKNQIAANVNDEMSVSETEDVSNVTAFESKGKKALKSLLSDLKDIRSLISADAQ